MAGWLTDGVPLNTLYTGNEQVSVDTQLSSGANPQTAASNLVQLATVLGLLQNTTDGSTVSGTRYYTNVTVGQESLLTGVIAKVGGTGGTDKWIAELHDSSGTLVATSTTSGTTAGTADTFQQFAFTTAYTAQPGTYYVALQSNGTTAKYAALNGPDIGQPVVNGSAAGTFGTGASITPPTAYSAGTAPVVMLY